MCAHSRGVQVGVHQNPDVPESLLLLGAAQRHQREFALVHVRPSSAPKRPVSRIARAILAPRLIRPPRHPPSVGAPQVLAVARLRSDRQISGTAMGLFARRCRVPGVGQLRVPANHGQLEANAYADRRSSCRPRRHRRSLGWQRVRRLITTLLRCVCDAFAMCLRRVCFRSALVCCAGPSCLRRFGLRALHCRSSLCIAASDARGLPPATDRYDSFLGFRDRLGWNVDAIELLMQAEIPTNAVRRGAYRREQQSMLCSVTDACLGTTRAVRRSQIGSRCSPAPLRIWSASWATAIWAPMRMITSSA